MFREAFRFWLKLGFIRSGMPGLIYQLVLAARL